MRGIYTDYTKLYEKHHRTIESLADSLKDQAHHFYKQTICGHVVSNISHPPNELLIDDVVLNTMSDLDRIMAFHIVEKPTRYKYAAYIGFWWQRAKPFSCKLNDYSALPQLDDNVHDSLFLDICKSLNEIFITDIVLSLIRKQRPQANFPCVDRRKTFASEDIKDSIEYFLRYRQYTAQQLELFLKGLDVCPFVQ